MTIAPPAPPASAGGAGSPAPPEARDDGPRTDPASWVGRTLTGVSLVLVAVCLYLGVVSHVSNARAQDLAFDTLRLELAKGTAPVGPSFVPLPDADPLAAGTPTADEAADDIVPPRQLLAAGTPVALLSIPRIGLDREVVLEDSTSGVLQDGLGHDRLTAMPGQPGWVQILGRRWTFGGPFRRLPEVRAGDAVTVVNGQGRHRYEVTGIRAAGTPAPVLPAGQGRLVLVTASGPPFVAAGAVYVDAVLRSPPVQGPGREVLPDEPAALPLAGDSSAWLIVLLWCQGLLVAALAFTWARAHWGRAQAWFVAVPTFALVVAGLAGAFGRLLPNLL